MRCPVCRGDPPLVAGVVCQYCLDTHEVPDPPNGRVDLVVGVQMQVSPSGATMQLIQRCAACDGNGSSHRSWLDLDLRFFPRVTVCAVCSGTGRIATLLPPATPRTEPAPTYRWERYTDPLDGIAEARGEVSWEDVRDLVDNITHSEAGEADESNPVGVTPEELAAFEGVGVESAREFVRSMTDTNPALATTEAERLDAHNELLQILGLGPGAYAPVQVVTPFSADELARAQRSIYAQYAQSRLEQNPVVQQIQRSVEGHFRENPLAASPLRQSLAAVAAEMTARDVERLEMMREMSGEPRAESNVSEQLRRYLLEEDARARALASPPVMGEVFRNSMGDDAAAFAWWAKRHTEPKPEPERPVGRFGLVGARARKRREAG